MSENGALIERIIKNKLWIPLAAVLWISFAVFKIDTPYFTITIATQDDDTPVYIGLFFFLIWLIMQYIPPKDRRTNGRSNGNLVSISHVTRGLASRLIGSIEQDGKKGWMLFEDAIKLKTEHHKLKVPDKDEKITGLQLDITSLAGLSERAARTEDGKTLIRSIYADDKTRMA